MSDYIVFKRRHFYAGTYGAPLDDFARDGIDLQLFETEEDANKFVANETPSVYYLSHGEYARPEFTVMRLLDENQDWENERSIYRVERDGVEVLAVQDSSGTSWEVAA
tara:strand:- start:260 stop:583 length:324 start_codon:yes stop_codon:yes gene_type:complete